MYVVMQQRKRGSIALNMLQMNGGYFEESKYLLLPTYIVYLLVLLNPRWVEVGGTSRHKVPGSINI